MNHYSEYNIKKSLDHVIYEWFISPEVINYVGEAIYIYCKDELNVSINEVKSRDTVVIWKADESLVLPQPKKGYFKKIMLLSFCLMTKKDERNERMMKLTDKLFELCYPMCNIPIYNWNVSPKVQVNSAILKGVIDEDGILATVDGYKIREINVPIEIPM